jgi:hypothetical protein
MRKVARQTRLSSARREGARVRLCSPDFRGEQRPESSPRRSTRVTAPSIGRPFVLLRPKSIETFRIQAGASQAARLHWDERTSPHTGKGRRLTAHTSEWSLPIAAGASRGGKLPLFSNRPGFGRGRSSRSTNTYHRRCGPAFWREQRHQGTSAICALRPSTAVNSNPAVAIVFVAIYPISRVTPLLTRNAAFLAFF